MSASEITDEQAVERLMRVIATRHAKRAALNPPDLNDPSAVVRWLEETAKLAEEEFDQLMGVMPPAADPRTARLQRLLA
jgi:hypothetical protein